MRQGFPSGVKKPKVLVTPYGELAFRAGMLAERKQFSFMTLLAFSIFVFVVMCLVVASPFGTRQL